MGFVKDEEIRGYQFYDAGTKTVCKKCVTEEESQSLTSDNILTDEDIQTSDGTYYCDRCKKKLEGI